jgi:hypothetical protein
MSRSLDFYLEDIIEAIRKICSYTVSLSFEEFCGDERIALALACRRHGKRSATANDLVRLGICLSCGRLPTVRYAIEI